LRIFIVNSLLYNLIRPIELGHVLEPIERELAKRRQSEAGKMFGKGKENSICSNEHELSEGPTRDLVAKQVGLSPTTYQRAKTIIENAPDSLKEKVRSGETNTNHRVSLASGAVAGST